MLLRLRLFSNLVGCAVACLIMAVVSLLAPDAGANLWLAALKNAARPLYETDGK